MVKPTKILKELEKLYEKREEIDRQISEKAKQLVAGEGKTGKASAVAIEKSSVKKTRGRKAVVKKPATENPDTKKPRGRKPKSEKPDDPAM